MRGQHHQLKSSSNVCGTIVLEIYLSEQIFGDLQNLFSEDAGASDGPSSS